MTEKYKWNIQQLPCPPYPYPQTPYLYSRGWYGCFSWILTTRSWVSSCCSANYQLVHMWFISKKYFRPGGIAPSEWTRSVRAVRDTPGADYSAPGIKTTHRVTYRSPIAVSPFLLALSVSNFKQTLWRCGQLWPYFGMCSLGTRVHRDCNAMGDAAKISPRVPSTLSSRSVGRWEDMIIPGRGDPRNCVDLGHSEWDQKFGNIECEFSLYDKRRWKWDDVYLLRGLPNIYSPSLCPPPLPLYLRTTAVAPWRCTWLSELRDILRGRDRASLEMHLQAMIERDWRSTWRQSIWREARRQLRLYSLVNL